MEYVIIEECFASQIKLPQFLRKIKGLITPFPFQRRQKIPLNNDLEQKQSSIEQIYERSNYLACLWKYRWYF